MRSVPNGAHDPHRQYDYVVPAGGGAFGSTASTNAKIAVINWYTVGLYPMGENPDAITRDRDAQGARRLEARRLARHRRGLTATPSTTRRPRSRC